MYSFVYEPLFSCWTLLGLLYRFLWTGTRGQNQKMSIHVFIKDFNKFMFNQFKRKEIVNTFACTVSSVSRQKIFSIVIRLNVSLSMVNKRLRVRNLSNSRISQTAESTILDLCWLWNYHTNGIILQTNWYLTIIRWTRVGYGII